MSARSVRRRASPLATSATYSSTRSARSTENAMLRLSGDQLTPRIRASPGTPAICCSPAPLSRRTVRPTNARARLGPFVSGLNRMPPSRSSGSASSDSGGTDGRSINNIQFRSGLIDTLGVSGASTSAASSETGVSYWSWLKAGPARSSGTSTTRAMRMAFMARFRLTWFSGDPQCNGCVAHPTILPQRTR